jgi:hypothetical protein
VNLKELIQASYGKKTILHFKNEGTNELEYQGSYITFNANVIEIEGSIISAISTSERIFYIDSAVEINGEIEVFTSKFYTNLGAFKIYRHTSNPDINEQMDRNHKKYITKKSTKRLDFITGVLKLKRIP